MRVRVSYSTTVDDDYRRAINVFYGKPGLATRAEVRAWLVQYGASEDDNLMSDLQRHDEREAWLASRAEP